MPAINIPTTWQPQLVSENQRVMLWQLHAEHITPAQVMKQQSCPAYKELATIALCEVANGWWSYQQQHGQHFLSFTRKVEKPFNADLKVLPMFSKESFSQSRIDGYLLTVGKSKSTLNAIERMLKLRLYQRQPQALKLSKFELVVSLRNPIETVYLRQESDGVAIMSLQQEGNHGR